MTNKKQQKIIAIMIIVLLGFFLLKGTQKEDIEVTVLFYDKDGNLVGQSEIDKPTLFPMTVWSRNGEAYTSDIEILDPIITGVAFRIIIENTGNTPIDIYYTLNGQGPFFKGSILSRQSRSPFNTVIQNIESVPIDTQSQLDLQITAEFWGAGRKISEKIKTFNWRFQRVALPLMAEDITSLSVGSGVN